MWTRSNTFATLIHNPGATGFTRLPQNKGITKALNTELQWIIETITYAYIARLDRGDGDPERFYKQIDYLSINTDVP